MSEHYNQKYTKEDVEVILQKIKDCVNNNRYTISQNENRQENIRLINDYRLNSKKTKGYFIKYRSYGFLSFIKQYKTWLRA